MRNNKQLQWDKDQEAKKLQKEMGKLKGHLQREQEEKIHSVEQLKLQINDKFNQEMMGKDHEIIKIEQIYQDRVSDLTKELNKLVVDANKKE